MNIRLAAPLNVDSIVDGEGLRTVLWTQGCRHACKGCHNPHTHDVNGGFLVSVELIKEKLSKIKLQHGITISGGEPFLQAEACTEIARFAKKELNWNVWCYSGFVYEDLIKNSCHRLFLEQIDVLVDGPFILEQKSLLLKFKGSKNQRILRLKDGIILESALCIENSCQ